MLISRFSNIWLRFKSSVNSTRTVQSRSIYLSVGVSLFSLVVMLFLLSSSGFLIDVVVNQYYFFSGLVVSIVLLLCCLRERKPRLIGLVLFATSIGLSLAFGFYVYDESWDGRSYHQLAIYFLKNGWNPFYYPMSSMSFYDPAFSGSVLWNETYLKFAELSASVVYSLTDNIETGKMVNVLMIFSSFFISLGVFGRVFNAFKTCVISIFLALNYISLVQMGTFYVDGLLSSSLVVFLLSILNIITYRGSSRAVVFGNYVLFVVSALCVISTKLSGIPYVFVFAAGFFLYEILTSKAKDGESMFKNLMRVTGKFTLLGTILVGISIVTNYNPFITNIKNGYSPFYPFVGKNKIDVVKASTPDVMWHTKMINGKEVKIQRNSIDRLLISHFASNHQVSLRNNGVFNEGPLEPLVFKVPFFKGSSEVIPSYDQRTGGFGYYFGGMLMLSVILLFQFRKVYCKGEQFVLFFVLSVLSVSVIINPAMWWARYVPQLYLIPIVVLIFSLYKNMTTRFVPMAIMYYLLASIIYAGMPSLHSKMRKTVEKIYVSLPKDRVYSLYLRSGDFSIPIRFDRMGIKYKLVDYSYYASHMDQFYNLPPSVGEDNYIDFDVSTVVERMW